MNETIRGYRVHSSDDTPVTKQSTDYLRPKKGSQHPLENLYAGRDELGSNCVGREDEFVDYEEPPTDEQAAALCASCPVFDLCAAYAKVGHPAWGVWGGKVHGRDLEA